MISSLQVTRGQHRNHKPSAHPHSAVPRHLERLPLLRRGEERSDSRRLARSGVGLSGPRPERGARLVLREEEEHLGRVRSER